MSEATTYEVRELYTPDRLGPAWVVETITDVQTGQSVTLEYEPTEETP